MGNNKLKLATTAPWQNAITDSPWVTPLVIDASKLPELTDEERRHNARLSNSEIVRYKDSNGNIHTEPRGIGMSGTDPLGSIYVGTVATNPIIKAINKGVLYALGMAGNNWARGKLISNEMDRSFTRSPISGYINGEHKMLLIPDLVNLKMQDIRNNYEVSDYIKDPLVERLAKADMFTPMYLVKPNAHFKAHLEDIIARSKKYKGTADEASIRKYGSEPYYLGYFDNPGSPGVHFTKSNISFIDPTEMDPNSVMFHEAIMHGTLKFIPEAAKDAYKKAIELISKKLLFTPDVNPNYLRYNFYGKTYKVPKATLNWEELRATLGEIREEIYRKLLKEKGIAETEVTPEVLNSLKIPFIQLIDRMSLIDLMNIANRNGYGHFYAKVLPTTGLLNYIKDLIKYAPAGAPLAFINKNKKGGVLLKRGSKIHIKKKNRGKFTSYCGGNVTSACIARAKASGNPTLVKRATFALNSRHWSKKHRNGGLIIQLFDINRLINLLNNM